MMEINYKRTILWLYSRKETQMKKMIIIFSLLFLIAHSSSSVAATIGACQDKVCVDYFKQYKKYAKAGYADAMFTMGELYSYGHGTKVSMKKAFKMYKKSAKYGSIKGQFKTAMIYLKDGEYKDVSSGVRYLKKAARGNSSDAAFLLGVIYTKPDYYEIDFSLSDKWLSKAYQSKHKNVVPFVQVLKKKGSFNQNNYPELWATIGDKQISTEPLLQDQKIAKSAPSKKLQSSQQDKKEKSSMEVITVTYSLHDLFKAELASFRHSYPEKGAVSTGSSIIGKSCAESLSCSTTSQGEFDRMAMKLVGKEFVTKFRAMSAG